jgi:hypothetical protein
MKHIKLFEAFGESKYNTSERIPTEIRVKFAKDGFNKFYEHCKPERYTTMGEKYIENLKDGTGMSLNSFEYGGYDLFRSTSDRVYFLEYLPRVKEIYIYGSEIGYKLTLNSEPIRNEAGTGNINCQFDKIEVGEVDHRGYFEIMEVR